MSDCYNPESRLHEEMTLRLLEARRLRVKLGAAADADEARVLARQLREAERSVEVLRHRLGPSVKRRAAGMAT